MAITVNQKPYIGGTGIHVSTEPTRFTVNLTGNPFNYLYATGNQTVSGNVAFENRPTFNGTGFLLSGEAAQVNLSGYITTGQSDLRYYPLNSNISGFITGVVAGANVTVYKSGSNFVVDASSGILAIQTGANITPYSDYLASGTDTHRISFGKIINPIPNVVGTVSVPSGYPIPAYAINSIDTSGFDLLLTLTLPTTGYRFLSQVISGSGYINNPITINYISSGSFGSYGEAQNYASLPAAATVSGQTYLVLEAQGIYFINRKPAGLYRSNGSAWDQVSDVTVNYFNDGTGLFYDNIDNTKQMKFELSGITPNTTRTLQCPDKNGVIYLDVDARDVSFTLTYNQAGIITRKTDVRGTKDFAYSGDGTLLAITGSGIYPTKIFNYSTGILTSITVT